MKEPFPFDAFLSHNQADKPRVRRLAERLRAAGRPVNLRTSTLGLRISAGGGRLGLERSTGLFRDPANAGRRFIPLLLADCKLPDTRRLGAANSALMRQRNLPAKVPIDRRNRSSLVHEVLEANVEMIVASPWWCN